MKIFWGSFALCVLVASLAALLPGSSHAASKKNEFLAYVGTYTGGKSKGIYAYRFDAATGQFTSLGLAAETASPSFLAVHPNGKYLYAVNEVHDYQGKQNGAVSAFAINRASGRLTLLNQVSSGGADPCHISLDQTGKYVLVANYTGGSVAVFPVREDGRLGEATAFIQHEGHSVNPERQAGPHAHWIETSAHNHFAYVADLGLDRILIYKFDSAKGTLTPGGATAPEATPASGQQSDPFSATLSPGTGPRHIAFSPDGGFMYVLGELKSTVTVLANDARETYRAVQQISTLPPAFSGSNTAAQIAIHPNGKYLYTSNRGDDSIAVFAVDSAKGTLTLLENVPTQGKTPRDFALDPTGAYLIAANQNSDSMVVFRIDSNTGGLTPTGQVLDTPAPVCIVFVHP